MRRSIFGNKLHITIETTDQFLKLHASPGEKEQRGREVYYIGICDVCKKRKDTLQRDIGLIITDEHTHRFLCKECRKRCK